MLVAAVEKDARPAVFHVLSDDARAAAAMPHARADSLREDKVARQQRMECAEPRDKVDGAEDDRLLGRTALRIALLALPRLGAPAARTVHLSLWSLFAASVGHRIGAALLAPSIELGATSLVEPSATVAACRAGRRPPIILCSAASAASAATSAAARAISGAG